MAVARKIKVLIVDDSPLYREFLSYALSSEPVIEVVGTASNPFEARDLLVRHRPDVMTCDIEMPRMNGIEFIRRLLPQYAIPVVVISSISEAALDALSAGAVDFVAKPVSGAAAHIQPFLRELILKTVIASKAKVLQPAPARIAEAADSRAEMPARKADVIAIGASTGGTEAIYQLLRQLPPSLPGIVVVQHIPPVFSRMFAERLHQQTDWTVREARTGDEVKPGVAYVAPGDRHMRLKRSGTHYRLEIFEGEKVNGHCPSVDVLFESAAREAGPAAIGVILTGMGIDGARGLLAMRGQGAVTIGQDEATSAVYGMPKAAFDRGAVLKQRPLPHIPELLTALCR